MPPPSIELLDRRGDPTSVVPENGSWRVRVVDPDRDYYETPDILILETTSTATGDQELFTLRETGPSTGVFEGVVESATGPSGFGNHILETATGPAPDFTLDTVQLRHLRLDSTYLTINATVAPSITELVDDFGNPAAAYTVGHPVRVRVEDHNLDSPFVVGTTTVQLTTLCNDIETLVLTETGAATQVYEGSLGSNTGPTFGVPGDGAVQLVWPIPDFVTAVHADANGGTQSSDIAGSNNGAIIFIDEHGGPPASLLEGSRARLRVYEYLGGYPPTQQSLTATLSSAIGGDQQTVQLWETGPATGVYEGWIAIEPTHDPGNYQLFISRIVHGPGSPPTYDTLTASYMPYDGPLVTATAQVTGFAEIAVIDEDGRKVEALPVGDRLRVRVRNPAEKEADWVLATVRSPAFYEREPMALFRTAAGSDVFEGSLPMVEGYPTAFNGTLEVYLGETIEVDHVSAGATDAVQATFVPTGLRIQFLDEDGEPTDRLLLGFPVRVRYFNQSPNLPVGELWVQSDYPGWDAERIPLTPTSQAGISAGSVPMGQGTAVYNDGRLDVTEISDPLPGRYNTVSASIPCPDFPVCPKASAEIVPALVAFVGEHGKPVDAYAVGGRVSIRLTKKGWPTDVEQAQVVVRSLSTGSEETVTLTETGIDTNRFVGSVLTADVDGPATTGRVRVRAGEMISVVYINAAGTVSVDDTARIATGTAELLDADGNPAESYLIGTAVHVRAVQLSANTHPTAVNVVPVTIWTATASSQTWDREYLTLTETGPDTGVFTGTMAFPHGYPSPVDGSLQAYYGLYDWEVDFNPMTVVVSLPNDPYTVADRAATHPAEMSFVDAQGNPTETLALGGPVRLRVTDLSGSPDWAGTIQVRLASAYSGDTVDLVLTESGPATGLYEAVAPSASGAAVSGDTTLQAAPGEPVRAFHLSSYGDAVVAIATGVMGVNEPPVANADQVFRAEDTFVSVSLNVLANDSDPEGQPLQVTGIDSYLSDGGTVTFTANGVLTFTPAPNYWGTLEVTYTVSDGLMTATAVASFIVDPVLDGPVAVPDTVTILEGGQVQISVRDNDLVGDTLGLSVGTVTNGAHGTAVNLGNTWVVYTATDYDYSGTDTFTYVIEDGAGLTATGTVTVIIDPVDDFILVQDDAATTTEDTPVTIAVLANDADVDSPKSVTSVNQAVHGTVVLNPDSTITYTPAANYSGTDTFTYIGAGTPPNDDEGAVTITIVAANDAPVANDATFSVAENAAIGATVGTVTATDPDLPAQTLTYAITGGNAAGIFAIDGATGAITVANGAALDFETTPSFTLTVTVMDDGTPGLSDTGTVTVNVINQNESPTATADSSSTNEDAAVSISVLANDTDPENNALAVTAVTPGTKGTVTFTATTVTYTPAANTNGSDAFTYTVSDGNGATATATVTVSVTAVNDAPTAVADTAVTRENTAIGINLLANDVDVEGNALSIIAVSTPAFGTAASFAGNPSIAYTPSSNFNGVDTFTYTVSDGQGGTATGIVTITVKDALERVAVLGTNSVYVQTGADVLSGDVIANRSGTGPFLHSGVELSIAGTVTTAAGYDVQANRMNLAAGSTVGGDAFYNTRTGTGGVTGSTTSPLTLPIFPTLPAMLTATPGSTNISVGTNGTRILSAGSYGDLVVGRKGVVSLSGGGTFHFRSIRLDREARLIFTDPSQVRVQQRLTTANLVDVGPALNAAFDASSIIFYVGGINGTGGGLAETPKAVEIGTDTALDANLYAPNGTIWLRDRTQARGSYLGKDVQVGVDVQVTLDSFHTGQ